MRFPRGRKSQRETMRQGLAVQRFYAAALSDDDPRKAENAERLEREAASIAPKRERIRRPVDGKPVRPSEHQEQSAVIKWWALVHKQYHLPEFALFAIPNGGARDLITGARLKAEGVRAGVVDLMLANTNGSSAGLFLEMKVGSNKPSTEQDAFIAYLKSQNYEASVHWDSASAIAAIKDYLRGPAFDMVLP